MLAYVCTACNNGYFSILVLPIWSGKQMIDFSMFTYYAELGWYQFNINIKTSLNSNSTRNKNMLLDMFRVRSWISGFLDFCRPI